MKERSSMHLEKRGKLIYLLREMIVADLARCLLNPKGSDQLF